YRYISKQIIFLKYMLSQKRYNHVIKVLISDYYYLLLAIINKEERYVYLNERSIIEGYLRMIVRNDDRENYITRSIFDKLKQRESVSLAYYNTIREEYRISCGYIHGD